MARHYATRRSGPHRMTPARKAALRKAQLASARKRRKRQIAVGVTVGGLALGGTLSARHHYSDSKISFGKRSPTVRGHISGKAVLKKFSVYKNDGIPYNPDIIHGKKVKSKVKSKSRIKYADRSVTVNLTHRNKAGDRTISYTHRPLFKGSHVHPGWPKQTQPKGNVSHRPSNPRSAHGWHQGKPYYLKKWPTSVDDLKIGRPLVPRNKK